MRVQPGSERSFGHLTQAHPSLWADHVAERMRAVEEPPKREGAPTSSTSFGDLLHGDKDLIHAMKMAIQRSG